MNLTNKSRLITFLALILPVTSQLLAVSDNFQNATEVLGSNYNNGIASILNYTSEVDEPSHREVGISARKSAWWKWTAESNGFCTVSTLAQTDDQYVMDTVLAVYTGTAVNNLTLVTLNDDHSMSLSGAGYFGSSSTFYATQGTTYHIAVDGRLPASINANNHKVRLSLRFLTAAPERRLGVISNPYEEGLNGTISLIKTANHAFSAKLTLAGKTYPFKGVFDQAGYFSLSIERKVAPGASPLPPLTLLLDGAKNGGFELVSSVSGSSGIGFATVQTFSQSQPTSLKGLYTAEIGSGSEARGNLAFSVSPSGLLKGVGVMQDGTKVTYSSPLCENDDTSSLALLYVPLYRNKGFFSSYLKLTEKGAEDEVTQAFAYFSRPANEASPFYTEGVLKFSFPIVGGTYTPPTKGQRALGFLDGSMGSGTLKIPQTTLEIESEITENLTLGTNNKITFASPLTRKAALKLNPKNGMVTGSINDATGKKRLLTGILVKRMGQTYLRGQVSGTHYNVYFEVIP